ncbi:MAG TPA: hypothetical protein PLK77_05925 [Pyrinomonadaceae bacterium]|nr:hypothetical protein [Pyrinomonadaceae bacterium]
MNSKLGKLIAVHPTSPALLQRAAIVAVLSFLFFVLNLIFYRVWQSLAYFILATCFLVVHVFTMIGWWMQKRNAASIYANGLVYRKREIFLDEIVKVDTMSDGGLKVALAGQDELTIPASVHGLDRIESFIRQSLEFRL